MPGRTVILARYLLHVTGKTACNFNDDICLFMCLFIYLFIATISFIETFKRQCSCAKCPVRMLIVFNSNIFYDIKKTQLTYETIFSNTFDKY